jgi:cytochrome c oxidase assembly protein subunit 15
MKKYFLKSAKIALILVYLVIFAGAFVRLTGSGMGCPDWPKCFGYYIPPTTATELFFASGKEYNKGQVIIKDQTLLVAKEDFIAATTFDNKNWEKYTKHDYAVFNAWHTWVEYINRLLGALAGIACIITFIFSLSYWKENKSLVLNSFLICVLMGFQAWLGKTVVDSVLNPFKITTHMLAALLIVALQLYLIFSIKKNNSSMLFNKKFNWVLTLALGLTIIQIILGTSVREHVDSLSEIGVPKVFWLQNPSISFYIHRSFSIIVLLTTIYLFSYNKKLNLGFKKLNWVLFLIGIEIITGIVMFYFDFPFGSQTVHIVLATILFAIQFYLILESKSKKSTF